MFKNNEVAHCFVGVFVNCKVLGPASVLIETQTEGILLGYTYIFNEWGSKPFDLSLHVQTSMGMQPICTCRVCVKHYCICLACACAARHNHTIFYRIAACNTALKTVHFNHTVKYLTCKYIPLPHSLTGAVGRSL